MLDCCCRSRKQESQRRHGETLRLLGMILCCLALKTASPASSECHACCTVALQQARLIWQTVSCLCSVSDMGREYFALQSGHSGLFRGQNEHVNVQSAAQDLASFEVLHADVRNNGRDQISDKSLLHLAKEPGACYKVPPMQASLQ